MKILVISQEVWRDDKNGGNVLSNIFSGFDAEFAQIYCSPGNPSNNLCKQYYQMTDTMVINSILKHSNSGQILNYNNYPNDDNTSEIVVAENKKFYSFFRKFRFESFLAVKEVLWSISKWNNKELENFILDFNPDIIFAPCYANQFMLKLNRYVLNLTKMPVISYISDDSYSLKQFRMSTIYWINKFMLRKNLRNTFPFYNLTYTMTDEQLKECQDAFHCKMKILRKSIDISQIPQKISVNNPIRLIYAGGIYCGRWKTLSAIAKALQIINKDSIKMVLDIYTGNQLPKRQEKVLNDGVNSFVHGVVSQDKLKQKYSESDIALHVESFDLKNKLLTRLSFSTKIVDCLASGCAVMAICWKGQAGYSYLKREDAAICVDDYYNIEPTLQKICESPKVITEYSKKAFECGRRNHQKDVICDNLKADFDNLAGGKTNYVK